MAYEKICIIVSVERVCWDGWRCASVQVGFRVGEQLGCVSWPKLGRHIRMHSRAGQDSATSHTGGKEQRKRGPAPALRTMKREVWRV
jgi:hypothetical protein